MESSTSFSSLCRVHRVPAPIWQPEKRAADRDEAPGQREAALGKPSSPFQTTARFVAITSIAIIALWVGYDLYILARYGFGSGFTISWIIYSASVGAPAFPFLVGLGFGLLFGHLFLGMHGT